MTSHFYNNNQKIKKCPLWCDTRCWSFKHSRKMLFSSSSIVSHQKKKKDNICFVREKKMADCVPLEEEMLEALCWLCTTTTWNNYLDGLGLPFSFYQSFVCYLPIVSFYSVCVCSGLLKFILVFLVFFFYRRMLLSSYQQLPVWRLDPVGCWRNTHNFFECLSWVCVWQPVKESFGFPVLD